MPRIQLMLFILLTLVSVTPRCWSFENEGLKGFLLYTCNEAGRGTCFTISSPQAYELMSASLEFNLRNPVIKIFKDRNSKIPTRVLKGVRALFSLSDMEIIIRKHMSNNETLLQIKSGRLTDL